MYILGISAFYHDSAACLLKDGQIIAAAQEERFTRKKHDAGFPHHAIKYCIKEAKIKIEERLNKYLKTYFLSVKLGGIRFSAIGEFNRPGKNVILQNQATIFEAIALCGDLTQLAKRDEIKLVRQYPEGSKIHSIDLLQDSIINSPYYFIHPNDVIYAVPLPQKSSGLGVTGSNTFTTLVTALTGSLALILTIITLNNL